MTPSHATCEETGGLLERRFASEISRIVGRIFRVGFDPLLGVPAKVAPVELVIGVYPAAENHQFHLREHLGVVVLGILVCVSVDTAINELAGIPRLLAAGRPRCSCPGRPGETT